MFIFLGVHVFFPECLFQHSSMSTTKHANDRQNIVLQLVRGQEEEGMRQLFTHYGGALMTIIQPILPQKEIAEEILHDVLLKVWNNLDTPLAPHWRY
jgi:RNA polymerase sigma-70 factor (ECF subfamily)